MPGVIIRTYAKEDDAAIQELHRAGLKQTGSFIDDPTLDEDLYRIEQVYLHHHGSFLVAVAGGEIIGMGGLRRRSGAVGEIVRMRVREAYQRRGIGSRILDELMLQAGQFGYSRLVLDTTTNQVAAQRLYESRGFREYRRAQHGGMEFIFYERRVQ